MNGSFGTDYSSTTFDVPNAGGFFPAQDIYTLAQTNSSNGSNINKNGFGSVWFQDNITNGVTGQEGIFTQSVAQGTSITNSTTSLNQCATWTMRGRVNSAVTSHRAIIGMCADQAWTATNQGSYMAINVTPDNTTTPNAINPFVMQNTGKIDFRAGGGTVQTWGSQTGVQTMVIAYDGVGNTIWQNGSGQDTYFRNGTGTQEFFLSHNGGGTIGLGATQSTFTATGSLNLASGASLQRNSVNISSFAATGALSGTFANTALGPCISGSTVTLTLDSGGPGLIQANLHGTASDGNLAAVIGAGLVVDGAFIDGETASKGLVAPQEAVATDGTNMSFSELITGLASGSHNVCLSMFVSAGTGTIDSTNSVMKMQIYTLP